MLGDDCFCQNVTSLDLSTQLVTLMHYRERNISSNTARWANLFLQNSIFYAHGQADFQIDFNKLQDPSRKYLLLYPKPGSIELSPTFLQSISSPISLVVLDGSWRQTRRMVRRIPGLASLCSVTLPSGNPSQYKIRRQTSPDHLSTFEAIARALGIIEGTDIQKFLEEKFDEIIEKEVVLRGWHKNMPNFE